MMGILKCEKCLFLRLNEATNEISALGENRIFRNSNYLSVPLHPPAIDAAIVAPLKWFVDAFGASVFPVEPRVALLVHESSNGCSPAFNRPRSFSRRFLRVKSISDAVADTCACDVRPAHGGVMLSRDVEKNPCCDILWPNCGRFIIFAFVLSAPEKLMFEWQSTSRHIHTQRE